MYLTVLVLLLKTRKYMCRGDRNLGYVANHEVELSDFKVSPTEFIILVTIFVTHESAPIKEWSLTESEVSLANRIF